MLPYLIILLMGALGCWWEYRSLYPKPQKYLDCVTGCGAQLLEGIHFNSKVEGMRLPNDELACVPCYLKIWDEVDESIGIPAPNREEEPPCIQATPETRKMVAKMTAKWPCAGDDLSNLDAEFEANLAAEKAEAVAREEGWVSDLYCRKCVALNNYQCSCGKLTQKAFTTTCTWCNYPHGVAGLGGLCAACILWGEVGLEERRTRFAINTP